MKITKDMFVIIEYDVRLEDGTYVKGENGPVSMNFVAGYEQVLPSLEKRLTGLTEGTETAFVIPAREAFGEHDEKLVQSKPLSEFPAGRDLKVGGWVMAENKETQAQYCYRVVGRTEEAVTMDFNHPLAGKDLHYRVKVALVRPALKEELEYLRPCEHSEEDKAANEAPAS